MFVSLHHWARPMLCMDWQCTGAYLRWSRSAAYLIPALTAIAPDTSKEAAWTVTALSATRGHCLCAVGQCEAARLVVGLLWSLHSGESADWLRGRPPGDRPAHRALGLVSWQHQLPARYCTVSNTLLPIASTLISSTSSIVKCPAFVFQLLLLCPIKRVFFQSVRPHRFLMHFSCSISVVLELKSGWLITCCWYTGFSYSI